METRITATELARSLSDVLNRVRYRGEKFLVERNGEPVVTLGPTGAAVGLTLCQMASFLSEIPAAGEDFADDLEAVQSSQPPAGTPAWR